MYKFLAKTVFVGKKVVFVPSCHSTNEIAEDLIAEGQITDGAIVITDNQTNGRGQRGNAWESAPNMNLTFSIIIQPYFLAIDQQFYLNIVTSLALRDLLKPMMDVRIKWPNDVYYQDKKLSGILVKNSLSSNNIESSVIGIGLNINQNSFETPRAASLRQITGKQYSLYEMLEAFALSFEKRYDHIRKGKLQALHNQYVDNLYWKNEEHIFRAIVANDTFTGVIKGITAQGQLEIERDGSLNTFSHKEIEFIA